MQKPSTYQPPHTITPQILNLVAAISGAIGRLTVLTNQARALRPRLNFDGRIEALSMVSDRPQAASFRVACRITPVVSSGRFERPA